MGVDDSHIQLTSEFTDPVVLPQESSMEEFLVGLFSGDIEQFVIENYVELK